MLVRGTSKSYGLQISFDSGDHFVGKQIVYHEYEPYESQLYLDHLHDSSVVLDVGANIGYYTLLASLKAKRGRIYAFEPSVKNYLLLEKNIRDNNVQNTCLLNVAVGNQAGEAKLYLSTDNQGDHQLYYSEGRDFEIVNSIMIDDFVGADDIKPDIIKVDTQGFDYNVLLGARSTIEHSEHLVLFTEFWHYGNELSGVRSEEYFQFLVDNFRSVEFIDEAGKQTHPVDFHFVMRECEKYDGHMHANLLCKK